MRQRFEEDEYFLMAMFQKDSRTKTIQEIRCVLPFINDDADMLTLVNGTLKKMELLTDQEYTDMDLEAYRQEPLEEV